MAIQPFATQIVAPQFESPTAVQSNVLALRQRQQENAMRQMEMQQLQQQQARRNELLDIYRGGGDIQNRLMQGGFVPEAQQFGKMSREEEDAQIKRTYDQLDMARQILTSAVDEPSYQQAIAQAKRLGLPTQDAPAAFDPTWVQGQIQMATPILERLKLAQQQRTARIQEAQAKLRERELDMRGDGQVPSAPVKPTEQEKLDARERAKLKASYPKAKAALTNTITKSDDLIANLRELQNHPGLDDITGSVEGALPSVRPDAIAAQTLLDTIKAEGIFNELAEMRLASPTGGALGNVSNFEIEQLGRAFGGLNQRQQLEDFKNSLGKIIKRIEKSKTSVQAAFDETYMDETSNSPQGGGAFQDEAEEAAYQEWKRRQSGAR
ncbi:MAG: hypothetical protein JSU95_04475 [Betaproteobacteria bacterium]|nr:MAG: hypothetical protein JSU95_04475 [Betaproteobacteria bacterium]